MVDLSDVDKMLAEIDENLIRNELSVLERSEHLAERKRLYELKHGKAEARRAAGMNRALGRGNVDESISPTFAADTAEKTGRTERAIQQDVQIAARISEDIRDVIRDTPIADSKTEARSSDRASVCRGVLRNQSISMG